MNRTTLVLSALVTFFSGGLTETDAQISPPRSTMPGADRNAFVPPAADVYPGSPSGQTSYDEEPRDVAPNPFRATGLSSTPLLDPSKAHPIQELPGSAGPHYAAQRMDFDSDRSLFQKQTKPGMLQQVYFATTDIAADTGELPAVEFDGSITLGLPFPTTKSPLLITPSFGANLLNTASLDLPGELYDVSLEVRHIRPFGDHWIADIAINPGIYGGSETSNSDTRIQGHAIGVYQWDDQRKAMLGVLYLDREDIIALPVVGYIWKPSDRFQADILYPKPRVAYRGWSSSDSEWWIFAAGELGGGSWGIQRASGQTDTATLTDIRMFFGVERKSNCISTRVEAGYVFNRRLEYVSGVGDRDLQSTMLARVVLTH